MLSARKAILSVPSQLAVLVLASAFSFATAQQAQPPAMDNGTAAAQGQDQTTPSAKMNTPKEGFWGHVNPFARKKWVKKQLDPINDQLGELDGVTAKNARDIQDVDQRSQAGVRRAQSTADQANQTASNANNQAKGAYDSAQKASGRVDGLNTTVNGLDKYHPISEVDVPFRSGTPALSTAARKQLDDLASTLAGRQGYILEIEAHSPAAGSVGIQNSEKLAESVKRYLVEKYDIPVYRMHAVALGNARGEDDVHPIRTSSVHVQLMENSLAADAGASQSASDLGGARP